MASIGLPVSRTKITIPALRPEILHRTRLLVLFDDLLEKKLIIVAAPAGYGKTTLLVDFAYQSHLPVCWLSLDTLDKDPQRFCSYLIASLEQRFPKFGRESKSVLRSLTGREQETEHLLSTMVNEIDSQIDEHFALVVDDYQFVDSIPYIRDLFSRFIFLAGENCHVILSSRRLPTFPDITLLVARQQVSGFDLEQLAFQPSEIRSLFEKDYGITLPPSILQELMHQTEGWITGLHLSASLTAQGIPDLTKAARTAGVDLSDYLEEQVLSQQTEEIRTFLLQTSLLEEFDLELCTEIFGPGNWKRLLKTVQQNNLFVLSVGPGGKSLRYHHLFQEFLQERVREDDPDTAQAILTRLAEVYQDQQEWEKACAIYRQSGNTERLAELIERAGDSLLMSERLITLQSWLDDLPPGLIEARPRLLSLKGALLCAVGDGHVALTLLDQAILAFRKEIDTNDLALAFVRRAAAHRLLGDYAASIQDANETLRLCGKGPGLDTTIAEAERFKGISLFRLGKMTDAIRSLENSLGIYERLREEESIGRLQMELGMTYVASGNNTAASNFFNLALVTFRHENNILSQANVLNNLGVLHHQHGDYEKAVRAFDKGVECAHLGNSPRQEALLLTSLGDIYLDLDEYESAASSYATAAEIVKKIRHQFLANYLKLSLARLARLQGRLMDAHFYLDEVKPLIHAGGSSYECGFLHLEYGCLHLVEEKPASAIANLDMALDYFKKGEMKTETNLTRIWLAAACMASSHTKVARTHLKILMESVQSDIDIMEVPILQAFRRNQHTLSALQGDEEVGQFLESWLTRALQAEAELPTLRKHLRRIANTVHLQAPHLTIQAFGKARVQVNGKLVTLSQWKTASVRELFFYLLTAPHPLTKEEIGAILWPELDAGQLKLRFKNELYRLRHALGPNIIQFDDNHYHFNQLLDYDYDVENLAVHLTRAKAAERLEDKISHLRAASEFMTGPYLQDIETTWIWPERERLARICLDALVMLAESERMSGNLQAAINACQQALKIDPCREDIHCVAMQLHADQGDRLAVIWQYQACRDSLRSELDVAPSDETKDLFQRLTA
jgi:LuxR family transcriptional regulator, maltose regulon positive regulatory protein